MNEIMNIIDAQTIRMCDLEEKHGKAGAYGRQILYRTLAQVRFFTEP